MAIERNAKGSSFINEPGEYKVKVTESKSGLSKAGKPMLTVTFETDDEKSIKSYFVKGLAFHMKALETLKAACGVKLTETADELVGKSCGIAVEAREPEIETGKVFMQIVGYGPAKDVSSAPTSSADDQIPF